MAFPPESLESESPLVAKLAKASVLALGQSLLPDIAAPGETMFLLLPSMMPCRYGQIAGVLASQSLPTVRYGFHALGVIVIGSWRASENLERFEMRAGGDSDTLRGIARECGRERDARFLIQWGSEKVVLSLEEAIHWSTDFQLEFCGWTYRAATPTEYQYGADVVLSFHRPSGRGRGTGVKLR